MIKTLALAFILATHLLGQQSKIAPVFQSEIDNLSPDKKIHIIIILSAKYIFPPYTVFIKEQYEQIRKERIETIKKFYKEDQASIIALLEENKKIGLAEQIRQNIFRNYVSCFAGKELIKQLILRDDISYITAYDAVKFADNLLSDAELNILDSRADYRSNLERLNDANPIARRNAIIYLSKEKGEKTLLSIIKMLSDENSLVRRTAVDALISFKEQKSLFSKPLMELLKNEKDVAVKISAIKAVGQIEILAASDLLKPLLKDQYPIYRAEALKSIGKLKDPEIGRYVIALISDEAEGVRIAAMDMASSMKMKSALAPAAKNLSDPVAKVRLSAATLFGAVGGSEELNILSNSAASERDPEIKDAMAVAVENIRRRLQKR